MDISFCNSLVARTTAAIGVGAKRLVVWGFNSECIAVIGELLRLGVPSSYFVAIVDPRPEVVGTNLHHLKVTAPADLRNLAIDALIVALDEDKETAVAEFAAMHSGTPQVVLAGLRHLEFRDPIFEELALSCLVKSYATGYPHSQLHLYQAIRYLAGRSLKGDVAEFGICKGGTVVFIKKVLDRFGLHESKVYGFDIFEGFPKGKSVMDLYRHPKCEFKDYGAVVNYCQRFGIEVIKGDICETYPVLKGKPLILSFFDTDNYSPAKAALPLCVEQTVPGGIIFFDHYTTVEDYLYTIGERMAAREFLSPDRFFNPHGTGLFIKFERS